jgi:nucleoside-diphosphate-sugar epimerase
MPSVLLTGASGFIGSHIASRLVVGGWHVVAPTRGKGIPWRLRDIDGPGHLEVVEGWDITHWSAVADLVRTCRPEAVVHAAAYGVAAEEEDPADMVAVNALGAAALADAAASVGCRSFVYLGTAIEYGPSDDPLAESSPLEAANLYGVTKSAGWLLADFYRRHRELPLVTLRPFNAYGPKETVTKLVPHVICSALRGESVRLTSGEQVRDFLFVDDVASAVELALTGALEAGGTYNVASGMGTAVRDLGARILELMANPVPLHVGALAPARGGYPRLVGNATRLGQMGWRPRVTLDEGLRRTIAWYRANPCFWQERGCAI